MLKPIMTAVAVEIAAPVSIVFDRARGSDLPALIKARGLLPGVLKVEKHDAPWSAPGQKRLLTLSDGSSLIEELTAYTPNKSFAYRASGFTGPFAALVAEGRGEWHFTTTGPAATRIDWTYSFMPKGLLSGPAVWFIVKVLWPGYIRAALLNLKGQAERAKKAA
jgi:hypothetical protein